MSATCGATPSRLKAARLVGGTVLSVLLAAGLCILLVWMAGLDPGALGAVLRNVRPEAMAGVVALTILTTVASGEKWRLVNEAFAGSAPSRLAAFGLTALGGALAQVVPAQSGPLVARAAASRLFRDVPPVKRNLAATVYEGAFDLGFVALIGLASAFALLLKADAIGWTALAALATVLGWFLASVPAYLVGLAALLPFVGASVRRLAAEPGWRRLVARSLSRRLYALSVLRFAILVATADLIAWGVGSTIPTWRLAAALPVPVLAVTVAVTPGGLGINEWAMASALAAFGTPLAAGVLWTAASRAVCFVAALAIGSVALLVSAGHRSVKRLPARSLDES